MHHRARRRQAGAPFREVFYDPRSGTFRLIRRPRVSSVPTRTWQSAAIPWLCFAVAGLIFAWVAWGQ